MIITDITGYSVPYDINKNVSTIAAKAMIESLNPNCGFDFKINKKIIPGSGIGSSGSSAAASVYAINKLLDSPLNENELISFAMRGEVVSSISEHADNVSPAILGGIVMIKSLSPLEVIKLPTPKDLYCFVINPKIEIKTSFSRKILPNKVKLKNTTKQVSTFGSFIHALHTEDYELIGRSLNDYLIEKHRKKLIPLYDEVKSIAIKHGALGCSISGSGPSIFALTKGVEKANEINRLVTELYKTSGNDFSTYVSKISEKGVSTMSV